MVPEILLGPPGCGKTHSLLEIVEQSLEAGVEPEEIGLVSFTRRAAQEAIQRASERFGLDSQRFTWFRTTHSMCFRQLGLASSDVLQGRLLREFADWIGIDVTWRRTLEEGTTLGFTEGDRILHMENLSRVRCVPLRQLYDQDDDNLSWSEVHRVSEGLRVYKERRHLVDYTDMLTLYAAGSMRPHLRILLVDEAQDQSLLQWIVVDRLAQGCERMVVAGDDDQCVYRWAGAALEYFVGLQGAVSVLGLSRRVPQALQGLALDCIRHVRERRPKEWEPRDTPGFLDRVGRLEQVDFSGEDVLVLARNNYILQDQVVPVLRAEGIIYEYHGESSVDPTILDAIRTWEALRGGEKMPAARVRETLRYSSDKNRKKEILGCSDTTEIGGWAGMSIWHEGLDRLPASDMSYLLAARRRGQGLLKRPCVRLSTIHGAKGAEARHVVLMLEMAPRTAEEAERNTEDEARVWYVGLTRSSERLTLVQTQGRHGWDA